ncbi:UDP-N-acetylmuramoyl-L-alanyl-D-glutamate--2,6-diaminopimelate ligase [Candidatus Palibaumannia cicadellinicola]|uniref:UDP-N-acetylmuramoyl-L-alanyl-D-glutamate--2,6-diaminopimelate ligase n=1 Tax=Candidatus Palibaumannia cicadellinicola TaxID=186490 RepID=A0A0K2BLJ6_9GAMM|nr:UDP-N-acetylmuramoyl-L-alanyl-D-glutamate--2,6-diaminopimelate ligase [Candidatus Baumannia cicadellinicola]AKZ66054.1 UDP-N-acetylmuramoylalanyl-D-glutamate--2,6- diaminopimelate ligase [Candidatus Baumannia cicadellinicola]
MAHITLSELVMPWVQTVTCECVISGMSINSFTAKSGDVFIANIGHKTDGRKYISIAIEKGVAAVIAEAKGQAKHGEIYELKGIPIIYLDNLNQILSALAGRFYQQPSLSLRLIGVTGTNGKTTISHLLANWVHLLGDISAVMGTIGNGLFNNIIYSTNTTSSAIDIQRLLKLFYEQGVNFTSIEVSSHGLVQYRVTDLYFAAAVFSNLSRDHLDYHLNMKSYEKAKWKLFSELKVCKRIINADDLVGYRWLRHLPQAIAVSARGSLPNNWQGDWLCADTVSYNDDSIDILFNSCWGHGLLNSKLIGDFNVSNILLALATLLSLGYSLPALLKTAGQLQSVCGRMEIFSAPNFPKVIVDYAHTPDGLKNVLVAAKRYCHGKLWCVFGCGGDRDKGKRPLMGAIAEKYADNIIITNDNPRLELSKNIIESIQSGLININCAKVISCRYKAIKIAIMQAKIKDLVLIIGKGHENYQIIGNKHFYFSDRVTVSKILGL